jgi:hypothetical protein
MSVVCLMESPAHGRLPAGLASAIFASQDAPAERGPGGTREAEGDRLREQFCHGVCCTTLSPNGLCRIDGSVPAGSHIPATIT